MELSDFFGSFCHQETERQSFFRKKTNEQENMSMNLKRIFSVMAILAIEIGFLTGCVYTKAEIAAIDKIKKKPREKITRDEDNARTGLYLQNQLLKDQDDIDAGTSTGDD